MLALSPAVNYTRHHGFGVDPTRARSERDEHSLAGQYRIGGADQDAVRREIEHAIGDQAEVTLAHDLTGNPRCKAGQRRVDGRSRVIKCTS